MDRCEKLRAPLLLACCLLMRTSGVTQAFRDDGEGEREGGSRLLLVSGCPTSSAK